MRDIEFACEGRIAADPTDHTSKQGKPYARLRLAVGDGDATQWLAVTVIGEKALAEVTSLRRGDRAYLEGGSLRLDRWQGQDGTERTGLAALAWKVVPLGKIGRQKPAQARPPAEASRPAQPENAYAAGRGKRDYQAPGHVTDTRPAGGMPIEDGIPF
jgi:single-stranded DNA-binding protein